MIKKILCKIYRDGLWSLCESVFLLLCKKMYQYTAIIGGENLISDNRLKLISLNENLILKMHEEYPQEIRTQKRDILLNRISDPSVTSFVVIEGENICGYFHLNNSIIHDSLINYKDKLPVNTVYLFDDYTFFEHRGKGVHSFSIYERLNYCKRNKFKYAKTHILSGNKYSEKAYLKNGFRKTASIKYFNFIIYKKYFFKAL